MFSSGSIGEEDPICALIFGMNADRATAICFSASNVRSALSRTAGIFSTGRSPTTSEGRDRGKIGALSGSGRPPKYFAKLTSETLKLDRASFSLMLISRSLLVISSITERSIKPDAAIRSSCAE